ncbi:DUF2484 family protein [Frigidibacter mobilis]|uniref:DUF2484 family protein n=1 Tax=Frigidibacter mobilis TaxID=1335048 RepID=A0A159Z0L4_9RHOB|nr:DUF2484 family protein [Frigidibacter mobilis]AMY68456.1 hypothetical protein AKL17_1200 [Frigidibacter mobilis]
MAGAICLALVLVWTAAANVPLLVEDRQRRAAGYTLVLLGVPILGYVTWQAGPVWGLSLLALGGLLLRWPPLMLGRALLHPGRGRGNKGLSGPAE